MDLISLAGNLLLFALVFGMSATVDITCMQTQLRNYKAIVTGMACQFFILPLLGFLVVKVMDLDHGMGITLLVVTSSPGGSYSNWFCSMFNADLALSVSMTAISTCMSIFMLPLNLLVYTKLCYEADVVANLDWSSLFVALVIVISAIILGLYCSARSHSKEFNQVANHIGNLAGFCLIVFSATMTNTGDADSRIYSRHWTFYVGVMIPCLGGLVLANIIATSLRLKKPERVTVAIECCYQNVGIATSVALTMFDGQELNDAMGVPFFYGCMEGLLVSIYCIGAWKSGWTKAPKNAPFWKVLFMSYEVLDPEAKFVDEMVEVSASEGGDDPEVIMESTADGNVLTSYFSMGPTKTAANADKQNPATSEGARPFYWV